MNKLIKDNSSIEKKELSAVDNIVKKIADKDLAKLEEEGVFIFPGLKSSERSDEDLSEDLGEHDIVLKSAGDKYRTGNAMGFLGLGEERLVITSRFSNNCGANAENEDYFLQYLLVKVLDFPNIFDLKTDSSQDNKLFYLLFLFPIYLRLALRKGVFKQYICRKYNDCNVKGSIDIARHIAKNTPFIGRIAYSQREFSYDNYLTELVRHTIEFIKRKAFGNRLLAKVKDEVRLIISATPSFKYSDRQKIIDANRKNVVRHAYYREYLALQRLCLLILKYEMHQFAAGKRQIYGILFDGSWLWEEYMNSLVCKLFHHPKNKAREGKQRLFSNLADRKPGWIFPDFIGKDSVYRTVADAKYKPIGNICGSDYRQILAYMFRFDAKTGFFLYPRAVSEKDPNECLYLNKGNTYEDNVERRDDVRVIKRGLEIVQDAESYDDFARRMQASEKKFTESICEEICQGHLHNSLRDYFVRVQLLSQGAG